MNNDKISEEDDDDLIVAAQNDAAARNLPDITQTTKITTKTTTNNNNKEKSNNKESLVKYSSFSSDIFKQINRSTSQCDFIDVDAAAYHLEFNYFDGDPEFNERIRLVEHAIKNNVLPNRIYEGSSGSYFATDINRVNYLKKFFCC